MKKLSFVFASVLIALVVLNPVTSFAQDASSPFKPYFEVGPYFTAGAAIFAGEVQEGEKTGMQFAYTGGVLGIYELSKSFGVSLGLGYQSRPIYFRNESSADKGEWTTGLTYISIQPGIKFSSFMVGVDINMPNAAQVEYKASEPANVSSTTDVPEKDLGTVIDIRLGALIPLTQSVTSELNFFIQGAFGLTDAIKNQKFLVGDNIGDDRTYPVGTLQGGLCYTFSLGR